MRKLTLLIITFLIASFCYGQQLIEGFETYMPSGWTEIHTGSDLLNSTSTQFHSGSQSALFNFGNSTGVDTSKLQTPVISGLAPGSELRFWEYCQFVSGGTNFYQYHGIWISINGGSFTELSNLGAGPEATWGEVVINLSAYAGNNIQLQFVYKGNPTGLQDGWFLDDVTVNAILTCPPPTSLIDSAISQTTADVTWNNGANDSSWIVEYGPSGFTPGTGTLINVNTNPYTLTSLIPATDYDWYVRSLCSLYDSSSISGPESFTTLCSNETVPYIQSFSTYQPTCWTGDKGYLGEPTVFLELPNSAWYGDDYLNNPANGQAAAFNVFGFLQGEWLFSPPIDLAFGNPLYVVEFDLGIKDFNLMNGGAFDNDDTLAIVISTDGGSTWNRSNVLDSWHINNQPDQNGEHIEISLNGYLGVVQFGFYAASQNATNNSDVFIDNFRVGLDQTASINEDDELGLMIFPNPTQGVLNINLSYTANNNVEAEIYNSSGKLLDQPILLNQGMNQLDLKEYENGYYFIKVMNNNSIKTKAFVINK